MFMGGCSDLVGCPLCGKLEWLKNLSIFEGMLRRFNSSMVMYLTTPTFIHRMLCMFMEGVPMFHTSYDTGNSINCGSMYFVLGGVSPGRKLLCGPG